MTLNPKWWQDTTGGDGDASQTGEPLADNTTEDITARVMRNFAFEVGAELFDHVEALVGHVAFYANTAARDAAGTPADGQLALVGNQFQRYTAGNWGVIPVAGTGGGGGGAPGADGQDAYITIRSGTGAPPDNGTAGHLYASTVQTPSVDLTGGDWTDLGDTTGPQGVQGPQGPAGVGVSVLPPVADLAARNALTPVEGNLVLQVDTGVVWSYTGGAWVDAGHLAGPAGQQGVQGTKGDAGPTGAAGAKGDKGDQGDPGPSTPSANTGNALTVGSDGLLFYQFVAVEKQFEHIAMSFDDGGGAGLVPNLSYMVPFDPAGAAAAGFTLSKRTAAGSNHMLSGTVNNTVTITKAGRYAINASVALATGGAAHNIAIIFSTRGAVYAPLAGSAGSPAFIGFIDAGTLVSFVVARNTHATTTLWTTPGAFSIDRLA